MTEDDLYPLLEPLAGGQVYPYVAPLGSDGKPSVSPPWIISSIVDDVSADVRVARQRAGFPFRSMCIPLRSLNHAL